MIDGCRLAVVVPAHDEEAWIAEVLTTMPSFVDDVFVIDDGSADGTAECARRAECSATVRVWSAPANLGVGAAIAEGYRRAVDAGADVVAVMAGDGQMDPADLEAVVRPLVDDEADYVKGDRLAHPEVWGTVPPFRLGGSIVLSWLTGQALGQPIRDSQCGYTAISARAIEALDLARLWPRYGYPNDLLGAIACAGMRIAHVTVRPVYRGEASGLRVWHVGTMGWLIARSAWRRYRSKKVRTAAR